MFFTFNRPKGYQLIRKLIKTLINIENNPQWTVKSLQYTNLGKWQEMEKLLS